MNFHLYEKFKFSSKINYTISKMNKNTYKGKMKENCSIIWPQRKYAEAVFCNRITSERMRKNSTFS